MRTTEILGRDHEWIGLMTECLESLVASAEAEETLPKVAYELLALFETFADGRHQDKEERVLFPELLAAADPHDCEVLKTMLSDHVTERDYLNGMRNSVLGAVNGHTVSVRDFVREARAYLNVHRFHMLRETEILLPMATRLLTPGADARIATGLEAIEGGPGDPHGLREQIGSLRKRAGLPKPAAG